MKIRFIGLEHLSDGMAANLVKAGHTMRVPSAYTGKLALAQKLGLNPHTLYDISSRLHGDGQSAVIIRGGCRTGWASTSLWER